MDKYANRKLFDLEWNFYNNSSNKDEIGDEFRKMMGGGEHGLTFGKHVEQGGGEGLVRIEEH